MSKDLIIDIKNFNHQFIIDSIENSIWAIDTNYKLIKFNSFFENSKLNLKDKELKTGIHIKNIITNFELLWKPKYNESFLGKVIEFEYLADDNQYYGVTLNPIFSRKIVVGISVICFNISDIKEAEKRVHLYKTVMKESLNEIYLFDAVSYKFIDVNESALNNLGYTKEKITKLTPLDLKPDYDIDSFDELVLPLRNKTKSEVVFFTNHKRKDGTLYPAEVHLQLISDRKNQYFSAFILDLTERKKIKFDLLESYRIINSSPITVFLWDDSEHWNVNFVSKNVYSLLGYTSEEFLSNKISFKDLIYPEDYDRIDKELKNHYKQNPEKTLMQEYRVISKDGSIKWIRDFPFRRTSSSGNYFYYHGVLQDITEKVKADKLLKESEKKFKDLFDKTSDALLIITNSIFTDCNMATCKMLGYSSKNEFLNNHPSKLSPKFQPDGQSSLNKAEKMMQIASNNGSHRFEWIHTRKNGEDFPVEVLLTVISKEPNDEVIHCVWRDITERKQNEAELTKYRTQLEIENITLKDEISLAFNYEDLVYSSLEISDVLTQVEHVSPTDATVLILGETGTGKELIAKAIHNTSNRKDKSLIRVNCAAIPTELIESELFGHVKGSFTGAIKDKIGKFQLADQGTLFLDEIGEMPIELQPKLLRALQEGEIEPVGSSRLIKLDVRIIAATNKELEKEVENNNFRQDLYFRLNVFPIIIPPLRDRIDDIPVLIEYFLNKYCKKYRKEIKFISNETMAQMKIYSWPGNVRELENLIERAVITARHNQLIISVFENLVNQDTSLINTHETLVDIQSSHIIKTLKLTQWKIDGEDGAASKLDIKPSTLRDRMKKFGIKRPGT